MRTNKRTFAGRIRKNVWKERRVVNESGEGVSHDLVAPRDALNGDVWVPGEGHVSDRMDIRDVDSARTAFGDLSGPKVAVGCEWKVGSDAIKSSSGGSRRRKGAGGKCSPAPTGTPLNVSSYAANPQSVPTKRRWQMSSDGFGVRSWEIDKFIFLATVGADPRAPSSRILRLQDGCLYIC